MKHEVLKASDLLPLTANTNHPVGIEDLTPTELKEYEASAAAFVAKFNQEYPEGCFVRVAIDRLNQVPNNAGRVAIIVAEHENLNTTALTYPVSVANVIANQAGMPSFGFFAQQIANTPNDPSFVEITVKAALKGQEYKRSDGTMAKYKASTIVVPNPVIKLSKSILSYLVSLTQEVDKAEMLNFRTALSKANTPAPVHVAPDADVLGG